MESFDDSPIETAMAELDQKIPYLSQIKRALKSAASGKERYRWWFISQLSSILEMLLNVDDPSASTAGSQVFSRRLSWSGNFSQKNAIQE